jgi:hypothetical protein
MKGNRRNCSNGHEVRRSRRPMQRGLRSFCLDAQPRLLNTATAREARVGRDSKCVVEDGAGVDVVAIAIPVCSCLAGLSGPPPLPGNPGERGPPAAAAGKMEEGHQSNLRSNVSEKWTLRILLGLNRGHITGLQILQNTY